VGKVFESIDDDLAAWIDQQAMFFVSTAPIASDGLINCSPKGLDSFLVLEPKAVAYLDITGSGIETVAHLQENGRIVLMFCAFTGPCKIVRLHGTGVFHGLESERFGELKNQFTEHQGTRGIIEVSLTRISDSCGYGVPKYDFVEQRETLIKASINKGEAGLAEYRQLKNASSLDGLPGI
jgi:hypothetical protein